MKRLIYTQNYNTLSVQEIQNRINDYQINEEFTLSLNDNEVYIDFNNNLSVENLIKIDLAMCTLTYIRKSMFNY